MSDSIFVVLIFAVGAVCYFDFRWLLIPDWLNLALFGTGMTIRVLSGWENAIVAVVVAICVFSTLGLVRETHKRITHRIGLGLGDVKLAGASAVWFSPWNFPIYLFIASLSALIYYALRHGLGPRDLRSFRIPFGPFLGMALLATWAMERVGYVNIAQQ